MKKVLALLLVALLAASVFAFAACTDGGNDEQTKADVRVVAPDGAPALAIAQLFAESKSADGHALKAEIVAPTLIATEMAKATADVVIMPTNAGANLIVNKGAEYKLVATSIMGINYVIGAGSGEISVSQLAGKTVSSIGQGNTPQYVLETVLKANNLTVNDDSDPNTVTVNYVADGAAVRAALAASNADFGLVGEPAATNFSAAYGASLDLQAAWKAATGSTESYPQASVFVKTSLLQDAAFATDLLAVLRDNLTYINANKDGLTALLNANGSSTAFPAACIERCNVKVLAASDVKATANAYLKIVLKANMPDSLYYLA